MAEETHGLHIDTDWKKQAQEEKRRLAEQAAAKPKEAAAAAPAVSSATPAAGGKGRGRAEMPPASLSTLVQSLLTQTLFYLGDYPGRGGEAAVNLDMAKHQIDTLGVIEEKTKGNLTEAEQRLIDTVLYEARMRYVNVASQYA